MVLIHFITVAVLIVCRIMKRERMSLLLDVSVASPIVGIRVTFQAILLYLAW